VVVQGRMNHQTNLFFWMKMLVSRLGCGVPLVLAFNVSRHGCRAPREQIIQSLQSDSRKQSTHSKLELKIATLVKIRLQSAMDYGNPSPIRDSGHRREAPKEESSPKFCKVSKGNEAQTSDAVENFRTRQESVIRTLYATRGTSAEH